MAEQLELDANEILNILGNETRRKILAVLSEEPMYFNQLAKEVGIGQQAVLRHLQALEDTGIIETYGEKSNLGAPDRKYYKLNDSFILTISLSEDDFTIKREKMVQTRHKESRKYYKEFDSIPEEAAQALSSLQENLADVDEEISSLESRLNDLYALKQQILHKLHQIGMDTFEADERRVLYTIVEESPASLEELADITGEKESDLKDLITAMKTKFGEENTHLLFANLK